MRQEGMNHNALEERKVANPDLWSAEDDEAAEVEVGDFLYGLVRLLKPKVLIETGTYTGATTERILEAMTKNKYGDLYSCDTDPQKLYEASERMDYLSQAHLSLIESDGLSLLQGYKGEIDFTFIDGGTNTEREEQIIIAAGKLSPHGVIAVHDTAQVSRYTNLEDIKRDNGLIEFYLHTPRGLTILQKVWP